MREISKGHGKGRGNDQGVKMHRYASFMRPLWAGFRVSVPFERVQVSEEDRDFRFNRLPHDVIQTVDPIPEAELRNFELTDLQDGRKKEKLINYTKGFSDLPENARLCLAGQVLKGKYTSKEEIDFLLKKYLQNRA